MLEVGKVMAVDSSLTSTGVAIIELTKTGKVKRTTTATIKTDANAPLPIRLGKIRKTIGYLLLLHEPTHYVMEKIHLGMAYTALKQGMAYGMAIEPITDVALSLSYVELSPSEVNKLLGIKPKKGERKKLLKAFCDEHFPNVCKNQDEVDALATAYAFVLKVQLDGGN